jgi:hypothetical protein
MRTALVVLLFSANAYAQAPPPAPTMSSSREDVVRMLREPHVARCLPFTVTSASPTGVIRREGDEYVLRRLVLDRAAADAEARRRRARGEPWMPENEGAYLHPGPILARGHTPNELAAAIERLASWDLSFPSGPARRLCP